MPSPIQTNLDYEIEKDELEQIQLKYEPRNNLTSHEQYNLALVDERLRQVNDRINHPDRYEQ